MSRTALGAGMAAMAAAVAVCLAVLALWNIGWWFRAENTQRQTHLDRNSYGFQQADRDRITSEIGQVFTVNAQLPSATTDEAGPLKAQRKAITARTRSDSAPALASPSPTPHRCPIRTNSCGVLTRAVV